MKISVAMATYNGAEYLYEQLISIREQTRPPDELIVSDDCSTDDTISIIENFMQKCQFSVKIIKNTNNKGYAGNFNESIMRTSGDLVFLSDQDDVWFPDKIAVIAELAEKNVDKLIIMNDAAITDADLNFSGLTKFGQVRSSGFNDRLFVMGCCCAIRRELLNMCMPIPVGYKSHDDWLVNFAIGLQARLIYEKPLQFYRRHGRNESLSIFNRTTKFNKTKYHASLLRQALQIHSISDLLPKLQQKQMFLEGVARARGLDKGKFSHQLVELESEAKSIVEMFKRRIEIRGMRFPARFIASFSYWFNGGYQLASGFKSVIRDIIG